jgi:hypothetical protein
MGKFAVKDRQLKERYLSMVENTISSKEEISFINGSKGKIKISADVKKFLKGINEGKQNLIDSAILKGTRYTDIFITDKGGAFSWNDIDKSQYSGMGGSGKSDAKSTAMQERASMYAIEQGLNKNGYKDKQKFLKDCKKELKNLYPDMNAEWEETFFQQQKTVVDKVPNNTNFSYSRDDGFMEDISELVKDFEIAKKDSWNPADIWLVDNPKEQMKVLSKSKSIEEVNEKLRKLFKKNIIVGISLKKMSGKVAKWELVNVEASLFKNLPTFEIGDVRCQLDFDNNGLTSTDSVYNVKSGNAIVGYFQIRQNSKGFNNLKVEGTAKGSTAARLGKVPLDLLAVTMSDYKIKLNNKHQNFPTTAKDFLEEKSHYQKMFNAIHGKITSNITKEEFENNIIKIYKTSPDIALSKLMQIDFLHEVFSLSKKNQNAFTTNIYFLSQKKGPIFGPFGKLY